MLFWPIEQKSSQPQPPTFKSLPWLSLFFIVLFTLIYIWSNWSASSKLKRIANAKERFICYYLNHDHLFLKPRYLAFMPHIIQRHHDKIQKIIIEYQRDPTAQEQAKRWLLDDEGSSLPDYEMEKKKGESCLDLARSKGHFGIQPKKRIFVTLARLKPQQIQRISEELDTRFAAFQATRHEYIRYGWALIPAEKNWLSIISSLFIPPTWFSLLWYVLLLWTIGALLEKYLGMIWLGIFAVGGIIGNFLLMLILSKSSAIILGSAGALAALVGAWFILNDYDPFYIAYDIPKTEYQGVLTLPFYLPVILWFVFDFVDTFLISRYPASLLIIHLLAFGFGVGLAFALREAGLVKHLVDEPQKEEPLERPSPASKRGKHHAPLKPKTSTPKILSPEEIEALGKQAKEVFDRGLYRKAIALYREAISSGKAPLWVYEGLFVACEKEDILPKVEEFVQAIKIATQNKNFTKTKSLYHQFARTHSHSAVSMKERLALAMSLKRAELYKDAINEAEKIAEQGPDSPFFMKALVIQAESALLSGSGDKALRLYTQAENHLASFPEFRDTVLKNKKRAEKLLEETMGESIEDWLKNNPLESDDSDEIDDSMFAELDLYEALAQEKALEEEQADENSWDELAALTLKKDFGSAASNDGPTSIFAPESEDFFASSISDDSPASGESAPPLSFSSDSPASGESAPPLSFSSDSPASANEEDKWESNLDAALASLSNASPMVKSEDVQTTPNKTRELPLAKVVDPSQLLDDQAKLLNVLMGEEPDDDWGTPAPPSASPISELSLKSAEPKSPTSPAPQEPLLLLEEVVESEESLAPAEEELPPWKKSTEFNVDPHQPSIDLSKPAAPLSPSVPAQPKPRQSSPRKADIFSWDDDWDDE